MRTGSMAEACERAHDRRDGDLGVELGAVLLAHALAR